MLDVPAGQGERGWGRWAIGPPGCPAHAAGWDEQQLALGVGGCPWWALVVLGMGMGMLLVEACAGLGVHLWGAVLGLPSNAWIGTGRREVGMTHFFGAGSNAVPSAWLSHNAHFWAR